MQAKKSMHFHAAEEKIYADGNKIYANERKIHAEENINK